MKKNKSIAGKDEPFTESTKQHPVVGSEELQSLNEALETSKEDLHRTNKALTLANQQLNSLNEQLTEARDYSEAIVANIREPLLVLDKNLRVKTANPSFYKTFGVNEAETEGTLIYELGNRQWNIPSLRKLLEEILPQKTNIVDYEVKHHFPGIGDRTMLLNAHEIISNNKPEKLILLSIGDITKPKISEEANAKLAAIVQSSEDAIISKTLEGIITSWNHGAEKIFEYTSAEIIGQSITKIIPVERLDEEPEIIRNITEGKTLAHFETQRVSKSGRYIDISLTISPIKDKSGKIIGASKIARDISGQIEARKKIEESEKRFHNLIFSSPSAIGILYGEDLVITIANEPIIEIWGKGKEIIGKKYFEALPELAEQGYREVFARVYKTGIPFNAVETPVHILQNGEFTLKYYNFLLYPQRNVNNEINGIGIIATEVTSQALINNSIKESEERFRFLAQTLPQLIWVTDAQGNQEFASSRWKEYSGIEPAGAEEWKAIVHPDDYGSTNAAWAHSLTTGNIYIADVRLKNREGKYRWHTVKGEPVLDNEKKIVKWVGAFTDIHLQKIKEEKKDEFISIASHEMKTPLTTAKAYLQMLESSLDESNEDATLFAKKASQAVNRLNELISELLDVSKIRLGKLNYTITTFNFNDMIESAVENIQLTSPTHTIIKTGRVRDEVTGDKERLQQVVINLLSNAIKYSPNATQVFITIAQENDEIKVAVKDTGIGIGMENVRKIFDRYHRIEEHAVQFQGLGIGLFISYEIIQRHHGKLWVESERGKGSTFYFTLPVRSSQPQ